MPWIIVSANGDELERRELIAGAALVIGRSPECDLPVRDILLSRRHCRLEPVGEGWRVVDLNSKNGTRVGWEGVTSRVLRDGDHLRMGRTRIVYCTGPFEAAPVRPVRINRIVRPADPHEALTGTVTDFVFVEEEESGNDEVAMGDRPYPQPRVSEPIAEDAPSGEASHPDVASSFWYRQGDATATAASATAIVATPRVTALALPRLMAKPIYREIRHTGAGDTDLSLQADATLVKAEEDAGPQAAPRKSRVIRTALMTLAAIGVTGVALMSIWLLTLGV